VSYVNVVPDALAAAAADVAAIGSGISAAQASAAAATTVVSPAALDEVSIAVSTAFSEFGTQLQALTTQLTAFQAQLAQGVNEAQAAYLAVEQLNTTSFQTAVAEASGSSAPPRSEGLATLLYEFNQTSDKLVGEPLFYNGANGTSQASPNGQNGGLLFGNGGNGWNSNVAGVNGGNGGLAGIFGNGGTGGPVGPVRPVATVGLPSGWATAGPAGLAGTPPPPA